MNTYHWLANGSNLIRMIRGTAGAALLGYAFYESRIELGILGAVLLIQGVFNLSCCGAGGCEVPVDKKSSTKDDITYEELN